MRPAAAMRRARTLSQPKAIPKKHACAVSGRSYLPKIGADSSKGGKATLDWNSLNTLGRMQLRFCYFGLRIPQMATGKSLATSKLAAQHPSIIMSVLARVKRASSSISPRPTLPTRAASLSSKSRSTRTVPTASRHRAFGSLRPFSASRSTGFSKA